jgi:VIT1/CCC1 family predicted Fe2+/Mn2+ transporter
VKYEPEPVIVKKTKIPTYSAMVLEAVIDLNEKEGSSMNAIRKYILAHYDFHNQQKASFHNLTLKAANRAVASGELERIKHSFALSAKERERRKVKLTGMINFDEVSLFPNFAHFSEFYLDFLKGNGPQR